MFSGIQPTGDAPHVGNYLGALKPWVELQTRRGGAIVLDRGSARAHDDRSETNEFEESDKRNGSSIVGMWYMSTEKYRVCTI